VSGSLPVRTHSSHRPQLAVCIAAGADAEGTARFGTEAVGTVPAVRSVGSPITAAVGTGSRASNRPGTSRPCRRR